MNSKTKKTICLLIGIASILTIVSAVSYAYFTASGEVRKMEATISTGTTSARFADNDMGLTGELKFGESITKKFTIENTGTTEARVKMYWKDLVNTYILGSLTYTLLQAETEAGPYTEVVGTTNVPKSSTKTIELLASSLTIPVGKTYYYNLVITLNNLPDVNQNADLKAKFSSSFDLKDESEEGFLMAVSSNQSNKLWAHKDTITKIVFEDALSPKSNASYTYDLSSEGNQSIMSYLVPSEDDTTKYTAYIQANGKVKANPNSSNLFYNFTNLTSTENLDKLDTSNVTNMSNMFNNCSSLSNLDVSNFDTSNVTDISGMFYNCSSLTTLDVSNFDTSNVTDMAYMFNNCSSLTILDVSNFDTSNVKNMCWMFNNCNSLTTLDLSSSDTSNVTNMGWMFNDCRSLTILDVSNFDTGNVTSMHAMFNNCSSLATLDVSSFDTSNVTKMGWMFNYCNSLTTLDVSSFDTSNVTDMHNMFNSCYSLTILDVSNFDTGNVTDMGGMFLSCKGLTITITIRGIKCTNYTNMFNGAARNSGAKITVNYTSDASSLVDNMIATKSSNSNVVKGTVV